MSSTNRGTARNASNYYVTPIDAIELFLREWAKDESGFMGVYRIQSILDPCTGGTMQDGKMTVAKSYPSALRRSQYLLPLWQGGMTTMDIREDSAADNICDYLETEVYWKPDLIISNPPFNLAQQFITKTLLDVRDGGFVVMLLRLNFFGGQERKAWMKANPPQRAYVHAKRMGFNRHRLDMPAKERNQTDSIEYMHAVWQRGAANHSTILRVI